MNAKYLAMILCLSLPAFAETLSYTDLALRCVDLERLAVLPQAGERCAQWSSYDRSSTYDPQSGRYLGWSANGDGSGSIREEDGNQVLAEIDGPGVIWRIWSARASEGHVAIYLDGDPTPAIDIPFRDYFSGNQAPFDRESLCYVSANGHNCYVPIPFQRSCKVVARPNWGKYYHFTYQTFPEGTVVPTFSLPLDASAQETLDAVDGLLAARQGLPSDVPVERTHRTVELPAGHSATLFDIAGPRAITSIYLYPEPMDNVDVLREVQLEITWDEHAMPAVQSPLGDFFGAIADATDYQALPVGAGVALLSRWYMPFQSRAHAVLHNEGRRACTVRVELEHAPLRHAPSELGYFHALWHRGYGKIEARSIDWTVLRTQGRGRFCGMQLYIWNPAGGWWGEGDEKFFVDGETFPSTFGTGTEDYFGYAWCSEEVFARPYHGQTLSVPANPCAHPAPEESGGRTINYRWQISDNVPFQISFEGAVEKYFPDNRVTRYAVLPVWYQRPQWNGPLPRRDELYFEQEYKHIAVRAFQQSANAIQSGSPIAPLREQFAELLADDDLESHRLPLVLAMAYAEHQTGHQQRAKRLLAPYRETSTQPFVDRTYAHLLAPVLRDAMPLDQPYMVPNGDGSVRRVAVEEGWAIETDPDNGRPFVYFDVPSEAAATACDCTVVIELDCRPLGAASAVAIDYDTYFGDTIADMYRPVVSDSAAGDTWRTLTFVCPRARFGGRQNASADFRVVAAEGVPLQVRDVRVRLLD